MVMEQQRDKPANLVGEKQAPKFANKKGSRAGASFALAAVQEYIACRANTIAAYKPRHAEEAVGP
jgi:hypothetical protein